MIVRSGFYRVTAFVIGLLDRSRAQYRRRITTYELTPCIRRASCPRPLLRPDDTRADRPLGTPRLRRLAGARGSALPIEDPRRSVGWPDAAASPRTTDPCR